MTRRIFKSICFAALGTFAASILLFMAVLYHYFSNIMRSQLAMQTQLAAWGVEREGVAYFEGLELADYRMTWIGTDGTVLYDSIQDSSGMENHIEREEIKQAFAEGVGESSRYSATLMERSLYRAQRLSDGTILRLSIAQHTLLSLLFGMLQPLCVIFAIVLALSFVLAYRLSKAVVEPLNSIDLDEPLGNAGYEEIKPLLQRLAAQQRKIRKQSEELQKRRGEFEAVTSGMSEGIILLNEKRIILGINPAAMRLFGTDDSCIGSYLQALSQSLQLQELLQKAGDGKHAEMTMELSGGMYQLDASPVFAKERVSGVVLLLLNVSERAKTEQMRREFTANVSHELKTPLHTISGCAELLANGMVQKEDVLKFSRQIYAQAQRMICLVEDIMKLSHLDEGAEDMSREWVNLLTLAKETAQELMPEAEAAQISIRVKGESVRVYGIRQMLASILHNLCDNAVKYNRIGGSVVLTVEKEGEGVRLLVTDTGIGIPPEHRDRIFERFYRIDKSHSKAIGGTGLGLSIVKHAAALHNATITLESSADAGTTIGVYFPKHVEKGIN